MTTEFNKLIDRKNELTGKVSIRVGLLRKCILQVEYNVYERIPATCGEFIEVRHSTKWRDCNPEDLVKHRIKLPVV